MPILRFRVYWEEDDQIYRDVEILSGSNFMELHQVILKSFDFDSRFSASFFESNDRWQRAREINSEVLVNKKEAPALSMVKTPVTALVQKPDQKFIYVYDPIKQWTFLVELIGVEKEENPKRTYPFVLRKEGIAPSQYGVKGPGHDAMMEIEEKYDLSSEEMAEGFGNEGEDSGESYSEECGNDAY